MARRNLAFAALGPLAISLALVACTGAASPNPTSEVLGETSEPVAPASEPASSEAGATSGAGSSEQAGAEAVELIMWHVMRGALSPKARRVHRHYYAPMTTGMGLITFQDE